MEAKCESVTLSYDMFGSQDIDPTGHKSPIIFLHGVTASKETWQNVVHPIAVATGRKAYAYDARNHGDSGWSDEISEEITMEDLLDFMESQNIKQAVLVGHSMGGKTAMLLATKKPERVEKLIIEEASPKSALQHIRKQAVAYMNLLDHALNEIPADISDLEQAKKVVYEILKGKKTQENRSSKRSSADGSALLPLYKDKDGKFKWKTNVKAIAENFLDPNKSTTVTGEYKGPTLILYGTKSPYKVSADWDYIQSIFPSAQLRAIEDAAHQIHLELESIFINEVVAFINDD